MNKCVSTYRAKAVNSRMGKIPHSARSTFVQNNGKMNQSARQQLKSRYGLGDPRNPGVIRYVGKTNAPRVRHIEHCTDAGATDKCAWVETLRIDGILPQMIILAECQNDAAAMGKERVSCD